MRKLQAYRTELQKDLKNVENYKWKTFNSALNDIAIAALGNFEKEMNALPATSQNRRKVKTAAKTLFKYPVKAATIKSYQQVASNRATSMRQDLRKIT